MTASQPEADLCDQQVGRRAAILCRCAIFGWDRQKQPFTAYETKMPMLHRSSRAAMRRKRTLQSLVDGPNRPFAVPSEFCGRSPHCCHSLRAQNRGTIEFTLCGQSTISLRLHQGRLPKISWPVVDQIPFGTVSHRPFARGTSRQAALAVQVLSLIHI